MGVSLQPSELIVAAAPGLGFYCTGTFPYWYCSFHERISAYTIDIHDAWNSDPIVTSSHPNVWTGDSVGFGNLTGIRGMAATSFRDGSGNVDGLFLFTSTGSPPTIRAFTVEGEDASPTPSAVAVVSGVSSLLDYKAVPALAHGTWSATSKTFMAYVAPTTTGGVPQIRAGFLTRSGTNWTFNQTAQAECREASTMRL